MDDVGQLAVGETRRPMGTMASSVALNPAGCVAFSTPSLDRQDSSDEVLVPVDGSGVQASSARKSMV